MKPIKLVMSAFGSYAGREVLEFENIQQGIFLITGDTGAGKTTIFDAITYALYDETSGGCRDGNMMRSQYAEDETETYVEFTFLYRDEIYKVCRNPEYKRPGKRRNADGSPRIVKELSKVELTLPDGSVFMGRKRETDLKIAEIIGLDADQFRQVAMIAQGDFLKLLHAESKDRKIIFSKIFYTKIFWRIQELLKEKAKELFIQLEDNRKLCQREIDGVQCGQESVYNQEWESCIQNAEFSLDELVSLLECIVKEGQEQSAGIANIRKELTRKTELLGELLRGEELLHSSEEKLKRNQASLRSLAEWLENQQEVLEKLGAEQSAAEKILQEQEPILTANSIRLEDSLKKYEAIERKQTENKAAQKELTLIGKELEKADKDFQKSGQKQEVLETALKKLENVQVQKMEAENNLRQVQEKQRAVKALKQQLAELKETEERLEKSRVNYEVRQREAQAAADRYDLVYQQFFTEQAGILANRLEEGQPCPVCGSRQHPQKAELSEHAPTQEQVEHTKGLREEAEKKREEAYLIFQQTKQMKVVQQTAAADSGEQLLNIKSFQPDEKGRLRVEKELDHVEKQLVQAEDYVEKAVQQIRRRGQQQEELENLRTEQKKRQEQIKNLEYEKQQATLKVETLTREVELLQKELPYIKVKDARQELRRQQKELEGYRKAVQHAVREYQKQVKEQNLKAGEKKAQEDQQIQLQKEVDRNRRNLEKQRILYLQLKGMAEQCKDDAAVFRQEVLKKELLELQGQARLQEKIYMQSYARGRKNEECLASLQKYRQKQEEMRRYYTLYSDLSKTANGNLSGSIKLDFETYVQRQYFKQIISAANKRLVLMNNQQFILQCRDMERLGTQGQVGLDLDVYHLVNDSSRDVKTLSGGESFMAALAMALGLADIIQNEAGAIRLDTMFVDEGFGSLDDEARAQAIQVLLELSDNQRLVGIISHVNELKEQIDNKLLVTKDEKGSHVQWK